jgi:hypothetical protein
MLRETNKYPYSAPGCRIVEYVPLGVIAGSTLNNSVNPPFVNPFGDEEVW